MRKDRAETGFEPPIQRIADSSRKSCDARVEFSSKVHGVLRLSVAQFKDKGCAFGHG